MKPTDALFESLKNALIAANPGLVRREDLAVLETQLDEILEIIDEVEARLKSRGTADGDAPEPG